MAGRGGYFGGSTIIRASFGFVREQEPSKPEHGAKAARFSKGEDRPFHLKYYEKRRYGQEHFGKDLDKCLRFMRILRPNFFNATKSGCATAEDYALFLNRVGVATACGAQWTPQVCTTLIRLFSSLSPRQKNREKKSQKECGGPSTSSRAQRRKSKSRSPKRSSQQESASCSPPKAHRDYSPDDIASRLEKLGKVTKLKRKRQPGK